MDKAAIDVAKALVRLSEVTIFELRGEWRRLHRMPPPMRLSRDLLIRGITYKLVREWRGVTHTVLVCADGIKWRGQRYRSLSPVARKITGARWSGPRFFGLRRQQMDSASSARTGHGQG
jgi:Protein of unknown function (DUF2924)